jgi:hypothetical protein
LPFSCKESHTRITRACSGLVRGWDRLRARAPP